KLQDIKIRGCNIEKAWVYLPSGVSEQREEEESYVGWQSLLPNDFLGDGYTGKGMVIKVGDCTEEAEGGKCTPTEEVCDGKDNNCNKKIDDEALCPEEQECIIGKCRTFDTSYKVQPVIFISANFDVDKEMRDYINSMFEEARQFYLKNTGATFTMLPTKIVNGEKSHGLYWCNTNEGGDTETTCNGGIFRSNMETELKSKGIPAQPGKTITWIAAFGGGAYAGESADYPIVGDAALYAAKDKSCEYHWNYPNTGLLEQDKKILAKSPYFNTKK
ncbi:hypothetical protein HYU12_05535, partial [Candidatus Woesearchaeota archaeon]|nr:hypothetical protein [Candidatus Woesearchaeota archaeon]